MTENYSEKTLELLKLLGSFPPDIGAAWAFLQSENLSPEEVTNAGLCYIGACYGDIAPDAYDSADPQALHVVPNVRSAYICDVIGLLLEFGLEPNGVYDGKNIMFELTCMDNEYIAADTLALLFEKGGDPNFAPYDTSLFCALDFSVCNDMMDQPDRARFASLVHMWMAAIGYGGRPPQERSEIFKVPDSDEYFDLAQLRNHRNFYFGISRRGRDIAISIYNKQTLCEVARFW